ncbi:MAG: MaoC family dehydratase [Pseudorhodoplanes sp.]|nr:MaoC family dehydratase [Pseudorhodoplanes sp.]
MRVRVGERFTETIVMTPEEVRAFARAANDHNPVHHDEAAAANSRFKRLIASGTQTASRLMAMTANHFSRNTAVLGLDFSVRFHRAVYADETITLEWEVIGVQESPTLNGDLVELRGRVTNAAGELAVGATGRVLVTDKL